MFPCLLSLRRRSNVLIYERLCVPFLQFAQVPKLNTIIPLSRIKCTFEIYKLANFGLYAIFWDRGSTRLLGVIRLTSRENTTRPNMKKKVHYGRVYLDLSVGRQISYM